MTDYKQEVLKIYPDTFFQVAYTPPPDYLPVGLYLCRFPVLFGFPIPIFPIKIAHGWTEDEAWENAYNNIFKDKTHD
jgi:hypothetical protein